MATNTSKINVTELDFDFIKTSLIEYLQSQEEFSDYNFEGAALNVLMDILSYNTHMNAYMANMMANEMFLDSGSIRQSVVSKAKEIGYTPRSVRSSKAIVNVYVNNVAGNPINIIMDAGTIFDTSFKYTFATKEKYTLYPTENDPTTYVVNDVLLYDGNYIEYHYTVNKSDPDQRFIIPSNNVDTTTLKVFVQPDKNSSEIEEYFLNDDINRLKPDSKVYFLHETPEGYYEVTFGDGILGQDVINGNYITLSYIIAVGKQKANYIDKFIPLESIGGYGSYYIETVEKSFGGSEKESLNDIKFLAPKMYQSQKRAVTTQDYETFLLHNYPWIDTINSWGGEYNDPPIYGKVFFAIKPQHTEFVSPKLKQQIIDDLIKNYNVVTIVPEILNPDYIYINIDATVFYIKSQTIQSESELISKTMQTIYQYFADTTEKFKMDYRFSPMITKIDNTDLSFDSSLADIYIHKRIYPIVNSSQTFNLKFNNPLKPGTIYSSYFNIEDNSNIVYETIIKDNAKGTLSLIYVSNNIVVDNDIGNVDYEKGTITLTIFPYSIPPDTLDIRIYATPLHKNIISGYNQIIIPDNSPVNYDINRLQGIKINMKDIEIEKG